MSSKDVDAKLKTKPYLSGYEPGKEDAEMFAKLLGSQKVATWAARMASYGASDRAAFASSSSTAPAKAAKTDKPADKKPENKKPATAPATPAPVASGPPNFLRDLIKEDLKKGGRVGHRAAGPKGDIVRTRFPPEPNGYLHIGHAKSICLNFGLAKEFGGRCHLRFDDTNPTSEKQEYIDAIQEDVKWLGFDWGENKFYASGYFEQLYEWALFMIDEGHAYVDSQSKEEIKANRGTLDKPGTDSRFRTRTPAENRKIFIEMKDGKHKEGTHILRAKVEGGMQSTNLNMRDPGMYRILHKSHPHTGDKWCIYPIYDFAHGQEDLIEGITHSFCTLEFDAHRELYNWFLDHLPKEATKNRPVQTEFARLNVTGTVLSKRKLLTLVDEAIVDGWNDPRMPTLCGMRRRGVPPAAIRKFCESVGITRNFSFVEKEKFEEIVREDLDTNCHRRFAAIDPIKVTITDYPADKTESFDTANHPKNPELGSRKITFGNTIYIDRGDFMENPPADYHRLTKGGEVMLRSCQKIIKVTDFKKEGDRVTELLCTHEEAGTRKVLGHIGWVHAATAVECDAVLFDQLFKEDAKDDDDEKDAADEPEKERRAETAEEKRAKILSMVNPNSKQQFKCFVEASLSGAKPEEVFQFERLGYFVVDTKVTTPLTFNRTITLRQSGPEKSTGRSRKEEQEEQLRLKKLIEKLPPQYVKK